MAEWWDKYLIRSKNGGSITDTIIYTDEDENEVKLTRTGETSLSYVEVLPGDPNFDIEYIQKNVHNEDWENKRLLRWFWRFDDEDLKDEDFNLEPENPKLRDLILKGEATFNEGWSDKKQQPVGEIVLEKIEEGGVGIGFPPYLAHSIYVTQKNVDKMDTDFAYEYRRHIGYHLLDMWYSHNGGKRFDRGEPNEDEWWRNEEISGFHCTADGEIYPLGAFRYFGKETLDKFYEVHTTAWKELDGFLSDITDGIEAMFEELADLPESAYQRGEIDDDEYDSIEERYEIPD